MLADICELIAFYSSTTGQPTGCVLTTYRLVLRDLAASAGVPFPELDESATPFFQAAPSHASQQAYHAPLPYLPQVASGSSQHSGTHHHPSALSQGSLNNLGGYIPGPHRTHSFNEPNPPLPGPSALVQMPSLPLSYSTHMSSQNFPTLQDPLENTTNIRTFDERFAFIPCTVTMSSRGSGLRWTNWGQYLSSVSGCPPNRGSVNRASY